MKKTIKIFSIAVLVFTTLMLPACEDMLDTGSGRILPEDENNLNSSNDTVFSILGILSKVQMLSDRYIILGELRADLMDVTAYTNSDLREINGLTDIRPDNPYLGVEDYYSVINNCNYFIHKVDTTIKSQGKPSMLREYALAKTIRAWTYMQLALNFGSVPFYLNPIIKLEDSEKEYPKKEIKEIAGILIDDLEPCVDYGLPAYGDIETGWGVMSTDYFLFPLRWVLGDLYMWRGESEADFVSAATHYATLINDKKYIISSGSLRIKWRTSSFLNYTDAWSAGILSDSELITAIPLAVRPNEGAIGTIYELTGAGSVNPEEKQIKQSKRADQLWEEQTYAFLPANGTVAIYTNGDLRQKGSVYTSRYSDISYISKLYPYYISLCRVGLLYLRYAEAVNHAGNPALAFAVLKYGLNNKTLSDGSKVPPRETAAGNEYTNIFRDDAFSGNNGVHSRGSGESELNTSYIIPRSIVSKQDSINFVDTSILTELALETAFEGNRFHDLMRFSLRNDNGSLLANYIALKHQDNWSQIMEYLSIRENWFLPLPDSTK